jgi:hypothetical protein
MKISHFVYDWNYKLIIRETYEIDTMVGFGLFQIVVQNQLVIYTQVRISSYEI